MSNKHVDNATSSEPNKDPCPWEGCKGNPHPKKRNFPDNGCTKRDKYEGDWPEPFHILIPSYTEFGVKEGEYRGLKSSRYKFRTKSDRDDYEVQFHHIIPTDVMEGKTALKKNLELMGWNINDGMSNGICLPYFKEDQIWHYLQPHRGSHPQSYIDDVDIYIGPLEEQCKNYCRQTDDENSENDISTILTKIKENVTKLRNRILNWTTHIHRFDTLDNWSAEILTRRTYYKVKGSKEASAPPDQYVTEQALGNRKYFEIS